MRYTLATGEPVFTGFMRTRPSSTFWAWFYAVLYFLQIGLAGVGRHRGRRDLLPVRQASWPAPADADIVYLIGVGTFLVCVAILLVGRRIERTLEILNWVLVAAILGGFLVLALAVRPGGDLARRPARASPATTRYAARFDFMPAGADFFLLGALVAYSGAGGVGNLTLSNWARDKGYGMGARAGYIPAAVGGKKGEPRAHRLHVRARRRRRWRAGAAGGGSCAPTSGGSSSRARCSAWLLPALLYVTFIAARARTSAGSASPPRWRRASASSAGAVIGGDRSRSSAPGCCSRPSSTSSRA